MMYPVVDKRLCTFGMIRYRWRIASAINDCGWIDLDNVPLMVANTLFSSWDRLLARTSKLAVDNLCHNAKDIGLWVSLWGIFFMTAPLKYEIRCSTCRTRMLLCTMVTDSDVDRAKNLLIANMLQQLDGSTPICKEIGRQILCDNRQIPLHELEHQHRRPGQAREQNRQDNPCSSGS
ncbi:hypothetical protein quinque_008882 [Culex quinquefasciatus]